MSSDLHVEAMAWLRYIKQLPLVATEVGRWNADVLGVGPKYSVEVEVKKSIADLHADFRNKRAKHFYYSKGQGYRHSGGVPNYMYYIVPGSLKDRALEVLANKESKDVRARSYGLLTVPDGVNSMGYAAGRNVEIVRKAQALHKDEPTKTLVAEVTRRLSSEAIGLYQTQKELEGRILASLADIRTNIRASAAVVASFTPEPPEPTYEEDSDATPAPDSNPPERTPDQV